MMKTSQWRLAIENRCVFSARLKALSNRSGDHSSGGRWFHVAGLLTAKLRCPFAVRAHGTGRDIVIFHQNLAIFYKQYMHTVTMLLIGSHLSYDDCLEDWMEDYQNCSVSVRFLHVFMYLHFVICVVYK